MLAQGQPESLSATFRKAAGRVASSLVSIRPLDASRPIVTVPIPSVGPFRPGDFIPRGVIRSNEVEADAIGSGFLIDADRGIVVTTEGVLRGSSQVQVTFSDGTERLSSQIRRDPRSGLRYWSSTRRGQARGAIPGVTRMPLRPAIGLSPWALRGARRRRFRRGFTRAAWARAGAGDEWLETDTRPAFGLGGPLVNMKGEVVGISTPFPGRLREAASMMNHVVPAIRARRIAADLVDFGQVRRGFLGVQIEPVDSRCRAAVRRARAGDHQQVTPGTAAAAAGMHPGDRIVSANGQQLCGSGSFSP